MKEKIVFIVNDITVTGGLERVISNLANIFIKNNHEVKIISMFKNSKDLAYKIDSKVKIEYLFYPKKIESRYKRGIIKTFKYITILFKILKEKSSIIIGTDYYINMLISILNIKTIGMEHVIYDSTPNKLKRIKLKMYKNLKKLVVVNKNDYEQYKKNFISVKYIPNPNPYSHVKTKENKIRSEKLLISLGRLENGKGFQNLVRICTKIFKEKKEWKLHIYGEGSLRKEIESLIKINNMEERIILKGIDKNLETVYPNYQLLLSMSEQESFSLTLVEAQTFGLPVIAYDCPWGPRDIINDSKDGYLIENLNKQKFEDVIKNLLADENKIERMRKESLANSKRFSDKKIYKYWKNLFEEIS